MISTLEKPTAPGSNENSETQQSRRRRLKQLLAELAVPGVLREQKNRSHLFDPTNPSQIRVAELIGREASLRNGQDGSSDKPDTYTESPTNTSTGESTPLKVMHEPLRLRSEAELRREHGNAYYDNPSAGVNLPYRNLGPYDPHKQHKK